MGIFNEQIPTDKISTNVQGQQGPPGPQGIGFKLDPNNNYDMQNKKLVNVDSGTNAEDAINNSQLDTKTILLQNASPGTVVNNKAVIYSDTGSVHTKSVYFEDIPGPGDDGLSNQMRLLTPHQSFNNIHLNIPDLKNYDGNGGRISSEMMVTSVDQTVTGKKVFQNIEVPTPTSNNQASNKHYVDHNFLNRLTGGRIGGDLDMRGNTIKFLKLDNTDSAAARVAELKKKVDLSGSTMTGNLNMGNKQITNLGYSISDPTDVINLGFSDQKYLQKVSDSDLDLDDHRVKNSLPPVSDKDLTTKKYVDDEIAKIPQSGGSSSTHFVRRDGTLSMTADLDLGGNKITNLKTPTEDNDAVNREYLNQKISESHVETSDKTNVFKYLNDPIQTSSERNIVVNSFGDWTNSPHKYNKNAYDVTLQQHTPPNHYNSIIGFNLFSAGAGKFTLVFEFHYHTEMSNIIITSIVSTSTINKQTQRKFIDHVKVITQVDNSSLQTPDYLFQKITGNASQATVKAHIVIYGVRGWVDSVDSSVYDDVFDYLDDFFEDDDGMKMKTNINLNNHQIKNLTDGINEPDAVNKRQLDIVSYYSKGHIYRTILGNDFYDLIETSRFNLVQNASGIVINGVTPNFLLETKRLITDYNLRYGLRLSTKSHISTTKIFNQNSSFTFFMSFTHDSTKTCEISFSNTVNAHIKWYPRYQITSDKLIIDAHLATHQTSFTSDFQNKQLFIWICFNGSNLYKMALSNYSSHVSETFSPPVNFHSSQLEIDFDGFVNKIGLTDRFIDVNSIEHHRIMLEEKRNGAYLEI